MKKILSLLVSTSINLLLSAQCMIDSTSTGFISPRPDSLPCVERGIFYDEVVQFSIPASINLGEIIPNLPFPYTLFIDSVVISGVNGLPAGLNYLSNPADGALRGGQRGCAQISGTTYDPAGNYPITFNGYMKVRGFPIPGVFDGDTTFDFSAMQGAGPQGFNLSLEVIEPGATCREVSRVLDGRKEDMFVIYPNPARDYVVIKFFSHADDHAEIIFTDISGRVAIEKTIVKTHHAPVSISLSALPPGFYILWCKTAGKTYASNVLVY